MHTLDGNQGTVDNWTCPTAQSRSMSPFGLPGRTSFVYRPRTGKLSLAQAVCRLRRLVCRLTAEVQTKTDEMRARTSVLKTPKRERAARRATERGVVSLAGGCRCALLRNIGHAEAVAVAAHLDAGTARQTVCRCEAAAAGQCLGASALSTTTNSSGGPPAEWGRLDVGSACLARRRRELERLARIESSRVRSKSRVPPRA